MYVTCSAGPIFSEPTLTPMEYIYNNVLHITCSLLVKYNG